MVPGKQEGNAACEVPDTKERMFPRRGATTFQNATNHHLFSIVHGPGNSPTISHASSHSAISSPGVGAAQTFPGPTPPPPSFWEYWQLTPKAVLPPQGCKSPASTLPIWTL